MGADLKRKEARKRKFEGGQGSSPLDADFRLELEGISENNPPSKKIKRAAPSPSSQEYLTTKKDAAGKIPNVDKSISMDLGSGDRLATQKSQRFILFIGPSTISKNAWPGCLTMLFFRQSTLFCNG